MKRFYFLLMLPFVLLACQTQQDSETTSSGQKEYALEKDEVIPMEREDKISSENTNFSIEKSSAPSSQENIFEKIRFRKINVSRSLQNIPIPLESLTIHTVEKNMETDSIKRANLQINNLLQKWFDTNYQKLNEKVMEQKQSSSPWNEVQIHFITNNKVKIEMSSPFDGFKTLEEEVTLAL